LSSWRSSRGPAGTRAAPASTWSYRPAARSDGWPRPKIDGKCTWRSLGLRLPGNPTQWPDSLQLARERVQDGLDALARGESWPDFDEGPVASNGTSTRATFGDALESYLSFRRDRWTNDRYAEFTERRIKELSRPIIRRPVADITPSEVALCLRDAWRATMVTANRCREHMAGAFEHSIDEGWRTSPNPAVLRRLENLLDVAALRRHEKMPMPSMHPDELPAFYSKLVALSQGAEPNVARAARALRFAILTGARTKEAAGARRSEIKTELTGKRFRDWAPVASALWVLPKASLPSKADRRTKTDTEHIVPLSDAALAVLHECPNEGPLVFGSLGSTELYKLLTRRMDVAVGDACVHGMRASFSTWAYRGNVAAGPVIESALGHVDGNKVRRSYNRSEFEAAHMALLNEWSWFVTGDSRQFG
jgi:integrase